MHVYVWEHIVSLYYGSMSGPFSNGLLLQIGRLQQQTQCMAVILKHMGLSIVIFGSFLKSNI